EEISGLGAIPDKDELKNAVFKLNRDSCSGLYDDTIIFASTDYSLGKIMAVIQEYEKQSGQKRLVAPQQASRLKIASCDLRTVADETHVATPTVTEHRLPNN
ncbi:hypothetical protein HAX54_031369, partial [Datura stramonium]|nr:hypothetical protein [Datura stramonium]